MMSYLAGGGIVTDFGLGGVGGGVGGDKGVEYDGGDPGGGCDGGGNGGGRNGSSSVSERMVVVGGFGLGWSFQPGMSME